MKENIVSSRKGTRVSIEEDKKPKRENFSLPSNFGIVIPGKVYRGGWPNHILSLKNIGISSIVTLYASSDPFEQQHLPFLQDAIIRNNLRHQVFDIRNSQDFITAALSVVDSDEKTYIHCRAGANRTGLVCIVIDLLTLHRSGVQCDLSMLFRSIKTAIHHGFDFETERYLGDLVNIINACIEMKLLFCEHSIMAVKS